LKVESVDGISDGKLPGYSLPRGASNVVIALLQPHINPDPGSKEMCK